VYCRLLNALSFGIAFNPPICSNLLRGTAKPAKIVTAEDVTRPAVVPLQHIQKSTLHNGHARHGVGWRVFCLPENSAFFALPLLVVAILIL